MRARPGWISRRKPRGDAMPPGKYHVPRSERCSCGSDSRPGCKAASTAVRRRGIRMSLAGPRTTSRQPEDVERWGAVRVETGTSDACRPRPPGRSRASMPRLRDGAEDHHGRGRPPAFPAARTHGLPPRSMVASRGYHGTHLMVLCRVPRADGGGACPHATQPPEFASARAGAPRCPPRQSGRRRVPTRKCRGISRFRIPSGAPQRNAEPDGATRGRRPSCRGYQGVGSEAEPLAGAGARPCGASSDGPAASSARSPRSLPAPPRRTTHSAASRSSRPAW